MELSRVRFLSVRRVLPYSLCLRLDLSSPREVRVVTSLYALISPPIEDAKREAGS